MRLECCSWAVLFLFLLTGSLCQAQNTQTLVVYPKATEPIQRIYQDIIAGIKVQGGPLKTFAIDQHTTPEALALVVTQTRPAYIIALGRKAVQILVDTGYGDKLLVAATLFEPSQYSGVSLGIDSRTLLAEINTLLPAVQRVFIIAAEQAPRITVYPESRQGTPRIITRYHPDPAVTTRLLWQLLSEEATVNDAIVIPSDLDPDILYEIVQLAWRKKIILISTNLAHLKAGVLLVFYPDNKELGQQLGKLIHQAPEKRYESLTAIQAALNLTIAAHLGLDFDRKTLDQLTITVK